MHPSTIVLDYLTQHYHTKDSFTDALEHIIKMF